MNHEPLNLVAVGELAPIRLRMMPAVARVLAGLFPAPPPSDDDAIMSLPAHHSKSNSWENALLLLLFNNTNVANVGDATGLRGSSTAGSLYVSLHTADPGEAGDQTTSETGYTGYTRVAVARSGSGWTVTTNSVVPAAAITFPACTALTATITHAGIGTASSGAGVLLYSGTVTPNISVSNGVTPQLSVTSAITED